MQAKLDAIGLAGAFLARLDLDPSLLGPIKVSSEPGVWLQRADGSVPHSSPHNVAPPTGSSQDSDFSFSMAAAGTRSLPPCSAESCSSSLPTAGERGRRVPMSVVGEAGRCSFDDIDQLLIRAAERQRALQGPGCNMSTRYCRRWPEQLRLSLLDGLPTNLDALRRNLCSSLHLRPAASTRAVLVTLTGSRCDARCVS